MLARPVLSAGINILSETLTYKKRHEDATLSKKNIKCFFFKSFLSEYYPMPVIENLGSSQVVILLL